MAEVRRGTDVRLGRTVAVKRLRTDLASDHTFQARFRREAQSAASLNHPAIVAVYDTGEELAQDGSGVAQPYIVMEYVAGRTLRDILREGRKILPERALEIASGVLSALDYSHRMGIIHRDIKPGNVMLTPSGDVKVMDFGIARAVSDASSTMTQTAAVVGTAQYLSPEQARGESVDARSDVYSTGCLLYELLTGRPPFVGESPVSVAYQHVREQAPVPSSIDADLPPEIDAIVMKALAKSVDQRYQNAAAMKADIDRYLAGHPVQAPPPAPVPVAAPATGVLPRTDDTGVQTWEQDDEPRRRGPVIALALLLLAIIAAAIFIVPHLISSAPDQAPVPDLSGMTKSAAQQKLAADGFALGTVNRENSDTVPKGQVTRQNPDADSLADPGASVDIWISAGKAKVTIPDVIGHNKDDAARELRAAQLKPVLKEKDSDEPEGNVLSTSPDVGSEVAPGSRVTVYYASGPKEIPSVVGRTEDEATSILEKAGFNVSSVPDSTSTEPKGTVTRQSPDAGTTADQGYTVTILVSQYVEPSEEPSPTDQPSPSGGASSPNPGGQ